MSQFQNPVSPSINDFNTLSTQIANLDSKFIISQYEVQITISANDKAERNITSTIAKTGYDIAMVTAYGRSSVIMPTIELSNNNYYILARNFSESQQNTIIIVNVLYKKNS